MDEHVSTKRVAFELLRILQSQTDEEHTLHLHELVQLLQDRLGSSHERKTIRRNLDELIQAGFPIEYSKGWFYRHELSHAELDYLVMLVSGGVGLSQEERTRLIDLLLRFGGGYYAPPKMTNLRPGNDELLNNISTVREGLRLKVQVELNYGSWGVDKGLHNRLTKRHNMKCYQTTPKALVPHNGRIYLVGYIGKYDSLIHFRLDRVMGMRLNRVPADEETPNARLPVEAGTYSIMHPFMYPGQVQRYRVRLKQNSLNDVLDNFGMETTVATSEDGVVEAFVDSDPMSMEIWRRRYEEQVLEMTVEETNEEESEP